jgi:hypothetical protein
MEQLNKGAGCAFIVDYMLGISLVCCLYSIHSLFRDGVNIDFQAAIAPSFCARNTCVKRNIGAGESRFAHLLTKCYVIERLCRLKQSRKR